MPRAGDGDVVLLHRLQEGGLGAGARAVDLVGHQELGEDGAPNEAEDALAVEPFLHHLGAQDVGRHQIGRELDPQRVEAYDNPQRFHELRLGEAGNADQEPVPARQENGERQIDHALLAEDDGADLGARHGDPLERRIDVARQEAGAHGIGHTHSAILCAAAPGVRFRFDAGRTRLDGRPSGEARIMPMSEPPVNPRQTMADRAKPPEQALRGLAEATGRGKRGPAPVHLWDPPDCGDIDMRIAADGTWFYCGSPIGRLPLVQLFASILRKDGDRYVLVTPVEKVGLKVDDAPFLAVELKVEGEGADIGLTFRTNVDDTATADDQHPLRFEHGAAEGLKPYVRVRDNLWALVKRALYYDLVALGTTETWRDEAWFGVRSRGVFFPMCRISEIEGL